MQKETEIETLKNLKMIKNTNKILNEQIADLNNKVNNGINDINNMKLLLEERDEEIKKLMRQISALEETNNRVPSRNQYDDETLMVSFY